MDELNYNSLTTYLASAFKPQSAGFQVDDLVSLNNGWESDVYRFHAAWEQSGERQEGTYVLRIFPGVDARDKSAREYEALALLNRAGYPVPRVYLLERDNSPFGKPFMIMEYIAGEPMWRTIFTSPPAERNRLLEMFAGLLARLHALDWRPLVSDPERFEPRGGRCVAELELERWKPLLAGLPAPGFQACFEWLIERLPTISSTRAVPVHWDFHPQNLMYDGSRVVVIDWTCFDFSDYRYDLAWTLLLVGSHEGMHWREPLLRLYEAQAGHAVEDLEFFDVACALRRLFSVVASVAYGPEKMGMRPGAESVMKRQAPALRKVYELLLERTGLPVPEVEAFLAEADPR